MERSSTGSFIPLPLAAKASGSKQAMLVFICYIAHSIAMPTLRHISFGFAALLAASEVARWIGDIRLIPLVFDELIVAAALGAAAWVAPRHGTAPLAAAWGMFSGLMLGLLVPTLDHLLFGPAKEGAFFYSVVLALALAGGLWAAITAMRLAFPRPPAG